MLNWDFYLSFEIRFLMQVVGGKKTQKGRKKGNVKSKWTIRGAPKTILFINTTVLWPPKQAKNP